MVIVLTLIWELGEYAGDRLFGTALNPSKRNSAEDILFGTAGGLVGITFATVVAFWRRDASVATSLSFGRFCSASRIAACHFPGRSSKVPGSSSASWNSRR